MSQDNKKSMVMYQGDGSNNVFAVPMTKGKYGTISVAFVRRGLDNYEYSPTTWTLNSGLFAWADTSGNNFYTNTDIPAVGATVYNQYGVDTGYTVSAVNGTTITITNEGSSVLSRNGASDVDENTLLTWTGDVLNVGDYIVIERTTARKQPYEFPNNQKHIERSDDNLERQIQEVADAADRALKLDPTYSIDSDKMNPIEWLQTIVRCKDLTVRGLRFANNVLQYSKDDPEKPESEKTWYSLLNTDGVTNIRERYDVGTDTYYFEYSTDGGSNWKDVGEKIRHNGLQGRDEADCHPISAITDLQKNLDNKINKQQGAENAGKILKVDNDGNIIASSEASEAGGLVSVNHDDTLEGAGTDSSPLVIAGKEKLTNKITSCVLQSPKNINIGFSNGTITLHAGSIVYVPNGSGTYNAITVQNELSYKTELANTSELVCVNSRGTALFSRPVTKSRSGAGVTTDMGWVYDTDTNQISWYNINGVKQDGLWSFPICVAQSGDDGFDYIAEVFNSNGFIGNTVFALPNLEVYVPKGRKQDGTFNNIDVKLSNVRVYTPDYLSATSVYKAYLDENGNVLVASAYEYEFVNNYYRYQGNYITAGEFATNITFNGDCITGMTCKEPIALIDYNQYVKDLSNINETLEDKASLSEPQTIGGKYTFTQTIDTNNSLGMQINRALGSDSTTVWRVYDATNSRQIRALGFYANSKTYNRLSIVGKTGIEGYLNFSMTDDGTMNIELGSNRGGKEYLPPKGANDASFATTKWVQRELEGITVGPFIPDYSAAVTGTTPYTAPADGYAFIHVHQIEGFSGVVINNLNLGAVGENYNNGDIITALVSKNDKITTTLGTLNITFCPVKGA